MDCLQQPAEKEVGVGEKHRKDKQRQRSTKRR